MLFLKLGQNWSTIFPTIQKKGANPLRSCICHTFPLCRQECTGNNITHFTLIEIQSSTGFDWLLSYYLEVNFFSSGKTFFFLVLPARKSWQEVGSRRSWRCGITGLNISPRGGGKENWGPHWAPATIWKTLAVKCSAKHKYLLLVFC
jgi:hypothetical protein